MYSELISTALDTFTLESTTTRSSTGQTPNGHPGVRGGGSSAPRSFSFLATRPPRTSVGAALLDTLATLFFIVLTAVFAAKIRSLVKNVDEDVIEIADYTVYVKGSCPMWPTLRRCGAFRTEVWQGYRRSSAKQTAHCSNFTSPGNWLKLDCMLGKLADKGMTQRLCDKLADKIRGWTRASPSCAQKVLQMRWRIRDV